MATEVLQKIQNLPGLLPLLTSTAAAIIPTSDSFSDGIIFHNLSYHVANFGKNSEGKRFRKFPDYRLLRGKTTTREQTLNLETNLEAIAH